ncbi:MAG: IreB family regulatory phosphoprotein [Clostridia bacterium]|nr:IreB family regulatory phosphoprotein [Clostridia bacterium]
MSANNENSSFEMNGSLKHIYDAIIETGDDPVKQLSGYILSEDPTYIPETNGARKEMRKLDRDDILAELILNYFKA